MARRSPRAQGREPRRSMPREPLHVSGRNGTGKTTLLRVAMRSFSGRSRVAWLGSAGRSRVRAPNISQALAYAPHEPALKGDLTAAREFALHDRAQAPRAGGRAHRRSGSHGCRANAPTCRCACCRPGSAGASPWRACSPSRAALWLLDEPFTNLDARRLGALSRSLMRSTSASGGMAVVVAHHELVLADRRAPPGARGSRSDVSARARHAARGPA